MEANLIDSWICWLKKEDGQREDKNKIGESGRGPCENENENENAWEKMIDWLIDLSTHY